MNTKIFIAVLIVSGSLSGCVEMRKNPKQSIGTIMGAGAGALLGSQIGAGKGKLAAVAIGALGGAFLGSEIGKTMDEVDRQKAAMAQRSTLEHNKTGVSSSWKNPDNGNQGTITPTRTFSQNGQYCREYEHQVTIDGRSEILTGTACRHKDGTWRASAGNS